MMDTTEYQENDRRLYPNIEQGNTRKNRKGYFTRGVARSVQAVLVELEGNPDLPKGLRYFINIIRNTFEDTPGSEFLDPDVDNRKVVGIYCMMVPEELIYAAGAIPVRLSGGSYEASCIGDELVPRDTCPVVKASIGLISLNFPSLYERCDVVIVPTTCDSKRKMGEELSKYKDVWMVEVPHIKETEGSRTQWLEQLYVLKKNLERYTDRKIRRKNLEVSIRMIRQVWYQARRLYEFRRLSPSVISGREAALVLNAYCYDTASSWTEALTELNNELEDRSKKGYFIGDNNTPRILLAGSPSVFPNWKIPSLIEEMGAVVVTEESCLGDRYFYDPVGTTEKTMKDILAGIGSRYIMPCICPSFAPNEDRLYRLLQIAEDFKIDGIIYHVLKGCIIYDFELIRVEKTMKDRGIAVLRIETDYNPEDIEQIRTRVEAFMEMLIVKKK
ncbi:MAG: 2-hydroxyacyl-CoA dehydratase family protein [Thermodesulfobacteriota bacterium]|nr:2-hydroxyacyl-CoA dehydratase family protein [Thermodesulfobacteriota bacterium]